MPLDLGCGKGEQQRRLNGKHIQGSRRCNRTEPVARRRQAFDSGDISGGVAACERIIVGALFGIQIELKTEEEDDERAAKSPQYGLQEEECTLLKCLYIQRF